jgi:hypothetical protein
MVGASSRQTVYTAHLVTLTNQMKGVGRHISTAIILLKHIYRLLYVFPVIIRVSNVLTCCSTR